MARLAMPCKAARRAERLEITWSAASANGLENVLLRALLTARVPGAVQGRAFAADNPRPALLLAGLAPVLAAAAGLSALRRRTAYARSASSQAASPATAATASTAPQVPSTPASAWDPAKAAA